MAFSVAKPATYTVDTAHAKCPTHLWMLDEGSLTNANDQGSGTALDMTLQNAAQWGTDALGDYVTVNSGSSYYAKTATGSVWDASGGLLLISIFKTDSATGPATSTEFWFSTHDSTAAAAECAIRNANIDPEVKAQAWGVADDASGVSVSSSSGVYDQAWHMVAAKFKSGTATSCCAVSIDGGAFNDDASDTLGSTITLDRYAIGARARLVINGIANGKVLAAWAYEGGTYADWDDTWIANLYSDPWQFLNTSALTDQQVQFYRRPNTLLRM